MKIIKIGKASNNDIVISGDSTVSRSHMQMFIDDEANVFVTDLSSLNGTFINGVKISDSVKLNTFDIVKVGNSLINWKEYLLDDVDAQDAYKTIVDDDKQDLLDSLDDIDSNQTKRSKKKKSYAWYIAAACIVFGGMYMYFNTDKQLILDEWVLKSDNNLSFTFNDDGTFIKDSLGVIKKGSFKLVNGRNKKLVLNFNKNSLPVFSRNVSYTKSPKTSFPEFDDTKIEPENYYGNVFEIKNNSDYEMLITSIKQEVYKDLNNKVSSFVMVTDKNYKKNKSSKFDEWMYLDRDIWKEISTSNYLVNDNLVKSDIEDDLLLIPGESTSVLVLSKTYISTTYDRSSFTELEWGGKNKSLSLSKSKSIVDFEGEYYFKDKFINWNGEIIFGLMQSDFDYSYEFIDGHLEINGKLFKNN